MRSHLHHARHLIISQRNLQLIGSRFSYNDYDAFYDKTFAPLDISDEQLLIIPERPEPIDPDDLPDDAEEDSVEEDDSGYPDLDDELF